MAIVKENTAASGLDIFLRFNNILTDPISISYEIKEPAGSTIDSNIGFKRSVGHYDARNTVIPSGFNTSKSWKIIWTFTAPNNITSSITEEFCVDSTTITLDNLNDLISQIKIDLGLKDSDFTDEQFAIFIIKALNKINLRLCLSGSETLKLNEFGNIVPKINEGGQELILLAIECLIQQRKRIISVGKGIRVRDGDSEIDTTAGFAGQKDLVTNICGDFDKAIVHILYTGCSIIDGKASNVAGDMVWYGNSRIFANMDHDGDGNGETRDFSSPFDNNGWSWDFCR